MDQSLSYALVIATQKVLRRLATHMPWTRLREIGNLGVVRATPLIPIIGYLILFNHQAAEYFKLASTISENAKLGEVSSRLLWIYLGLCWLAVGSFIYTLGCPDEIKRYANSAAYIQNERENTPSSEGSKVMTYLEKNDPAGLDEIGSTVSRMRKSRADNPLLGENLRKDIDRFQITNVMGAYFDLRNVEKPAIRLLTGGFFAAGAAFLFMSSIDVFLRCLDLFAKSLGL